MAKATLDTNSIAGKAVLNARKVTTKPKDTDVEKGEVVAYTDKKGKTTYYVKSYTGKLIDEKSDVDIAKQLNSYYSDIEKKQVSDLQDAQSREINELTQTLQRFGYSDKQIKSIVDSENAKNKEELDSLNKLFVADGAQYAKRDASGNFVQNVDKDGKPIESFSKLSSNLSYNDPKIAPVAKKNIDDANNFVNQFNRQYNLTGDIYSSGDSKVGMNEQNIYKAYDKGYLKYDPEDNNFYLDDTVNVPDFSKVDQKFVTEFAKTAPQIALPQNTPNAFGIVSTPTDVPQNKYISANLLSNPEGITYTAAGAIDPKTKKPATPQSYTISADEIKKTWAYNPDDGLYYPPGTAFTNDAINLGYDYGLIANIGGKGFSRQLYDILGRGTVVGDKAYTTTKVNKKTGLEETYITNPDGSILKGSKPLVDTGKTDWNGNKIYSQTSERDTKYNKVSLQSLYMQDKDTGDIVYLGTPGMGYLHIEKQDGGLFGGGFGGMVGNLLGGLALSAVLGPAGFGLSTGLANVASSAVMSALNGGDFGDILKSALTSAVSSGLQDKFNTGSMDANTIAGATNITAKSIADSIAKAVGDISVSDSQAINNIAKSLVTNAISSGGDLTKAVEMTIGNAAANYVGGKIMQETGDKTLASSAANTINSAVQSGDVTTGLGAGVGTYVGNQVAQTTGSNLAGNLVGTGVSTGISGGDIKDALLTSGIQTIGSNIVSSINNMINTPSSIGTADIDPTSITGYSVDGKPTTMAGVPVDEFGKEIKETGSTLPADLVKTGTQIASAYVNKPEMPDMPAPPPTIGSTLNPTTGTAEPGTQVLKPKGGLPTSNVPKKVDVSTLTPVTGGLPPGLASKVGTTTTPATTTPTTPTGGLTTASATTPPSKVDVSTLQKFTGALPVGVNVTQPQTVTPTVPNTINVANLTPATKADLPPELLSKINTGGLSQVTPT